MLLTINQFVVYQCVIYHSLSLVYGIQFFRSFRAARIVCRVNSRTSTTPLLQKLHWLPVSCRIDFKVALLTFKILSAQQPAYMLPFLQPYSSNRALRSSHQNLLTVPFSKSALHSRSFSVYAPRLWNTLPQHVRDLCFIPSTQSSDLPSSLNLLTFKKYLKTYLFDTAPSLVP